jgi:NAD(P)-dependent dehydrogenase (short-subunit alcohol dehydrogenase family)
MDLQLSGKRALITGGSKGIGKAIALALAREGADVALLARGREALDTAAADIVAQTGRKAIGIVADTTQGPQVADAVVQGAGLLGGTFDILVNAAAEPAGFAAPPKVGEIRPEFFHQEMNTKVMGYLRVAQAVLPGMLVRHWGRIVNISGLAARTTGNTVGSMRNVSVAALTKNMADELGPQGVQVNCVHPGTTRTERTAPLVAARAAAQGVTEAEVERQLASTSSVGQLIDAAEVADLVAFLCSPRSRALNGEVIAAGGGMPGRIYY